MLFHIELHEKILTLGILILNPGLQEVMKNVKNITVDITTLRQYPLKSLSLVIYLFILKVAAQFTFLILYDYIFRHLYPSSSIMKQL
jgi:hypothetical protein